MSIAHGDSPLTRSDQVDMSRRKLAAPAWVLRHIFNLSYPLSAASSKRMPVLKREGHGSLDLNAISGIHGVSTALSGEPQEAALGGAGGTHSSDQLPSTVPSLE